MKLKKKIIFLYIIFFSYLLLIYLKNYTFCNIYYGKCSLVTPYGGDILRYLNAHYYTPITNHYGFSLYLTFLIVHPWLKFKFFLLTYLLTFYVVLFFCGLKLLRNNNLWKFIPYLLIVIFYPSYEGYSSIALKQGLGMIFMLMSIFFVKRIFSFASCLFILAAIMSHYVFLLVYFILYIVKFFSIRFFTIIFLLCTFSYLIGLNNFLFEWVIQTFEHIHKDQYQETWLRTTTEVKYLFVLFSFLPLFAFQIIQFKKLISRNSILKNLYKFHLLYCSCIFLFFAEYFYLNRFLEIAWLFYPLYLLTLFNITKISFKVVKNPKKIP
jgi:hypothetical protein